MFCAASFAAPSATAATSASRTPFLGKLVDVLGTTMGHVFPEVLAKAQLIKKTLTQEEESFLRTLDRGIEIFEYAVATGSGPYRAPSRGENGLANATSLQIFLGCGGI